MNGVAWARYSCAQDLSVSVWLGRGNIEYATEIFLHGLNQAWLMRYEISLLLISGIQDGLQS